MYFSADPEVFEHPKLCNLTNGTVLYLNGSSHRNLDCTCATTWRADPDLAGSTVITVFLVLSGVTVLTAAVPVTYKLLQSWRNNGGNFWHWIDDIFTLHLRQRSTKMALDSGEASPRSPRTSGATDMSDPLSPQFRRLSDAELEKFMTPYDQRHQGPVSPTTDTTLAEHHNKFVFAAQTLLIPLCNAQIFAGIVWVIWAFVQWPKITYYHEQFVVNFWWLTLTSVWISRIDLVSSVSHIDWRSHVQRLTLIISMILASILQILVAEREHNRWEPTAHGKCYVSRDGSGGDLGQNVFWVAGTIMYGIALVLTFFPFSRDKFDQWMASPLDRIMDRVAHNLLDSVGSLRSSLDRQRQQSVMQRLAVYSYGVIEVVCFGSVWLFWWCLVQFLSIWGAGNGSIVIETGAYIIFAACSMFYIIAMKIDNKTLIVGDEDAQSLGPLVLLLMSAGVLYTFYTR